MQHLTTDSVIRYVTERGILDGVDVNVSILTGGVSSTVLLLENATKRLVVKQARAKLDVTDDWYANAGRTENEAIALQILGRFTPDSVPTLLDFDVTRNVLAMSAAPSSWRTWKSDLLLGRCEPAIGEWLGSVLGQWHARTWNQPLPEIFEDLENFRELRIHPYFLTCAERRPELAQHIHEYVRELELDRRCLISGDFSPKNILVGDDGQWIIDFEVACRGNPAFDVAFLLTHLLLKAFHVPQARSSLHDCCTAFITNYKERVPVLDERYLCGLVGCLLLARVRGKSPVEYLSFDEAHDVEVRASQILSFAPATFQHLWREVVT